MGKNMIITSSVLAVMIYYQMSVTWLCTSYIPVWLFFLYICLRFVLWNCSFGHMCMLMLSGQILIAGLVGKTFFVVVVFLNCAFLSFQYVEIKFHSFQTLHHLQSQLQLFLLCSNKGQGNKFRRNPQTNMKGMKCGNWFPED